MDQNGRMIRIRNLANETKKVTVTYDQKFGLIYQGSFTVTISRCESQQGVLSAEDSLKFLGGDLASTTEERKTEESKSLQQQRRIGTMALESGAILWSPFLLSVLKRGVLLTSRIASTMREGQIWRL